MPFALFLLYGCAAAGAQIVLLRELTVVFHGNELAYSAMMSVWLVAGGAGGLLGSSVPPGPAARRWTGLLLPPVGALLPALAVLARLLRPCLSLPQGEILGPGSFFAFSALTLGPAALALSFLFALTLGWPREPGDPLDKEPSRAYVYESLGAGLSGCLLSLYWMERAGSLAVLLFLGVLLAGAGVRVATGRARPALCAIAILAVLSLAAAPAADRASLRAQWRGFTILEHRPSPYGDLVAASRAGQTMFFENGLPVSTLPSVEGTESLVHPAMLLHPDPRRVLVLGETAPALLAEVLKYPQASVTALELDPQMPPLKARHAPAPGPEAAARARVLCADGRRFLDTTEQRFDVILVALPEPGTLQINRYYTTEFFRSARDHLADGGLLALRLPGVENYAGRALTDLAGSLLVSLSRSFSHTAVLPLLSLHVLACNSPGVLGSDPALLLDRLRERGVATSYVNRHYLPYCLTPDRVDPLTARLEAARGDAPENRDLRPCGVYLALLYWADYASPATRALLQAARRVPAWFWFLLPLAGAGASTLRGGGPGRMGLLHTAAWSGLTQFGMQMTLILAYQSLFGCVYLRLSLLIAAFMAGLVAGSWLALRAARGRGAACLLRRAQAGLVVCPLVLGLGFAAAPRAGWTDFEWVFPALAFAAGIAGGFQFPCLQRLMDRAGATAALYGADLLGASLGAALTGTLLVPVLGSGLVCLWMAWINLVCLAPFLRLRN